MTSKDSGYETMGMVVTATATAATTEKSPVMSVLDVEDYSEHVESGGTGFLPGGGKRGHKCCGCCCDVRRAVIIINIISICLLSSFALADIKMSLDTPTYTAKMIDGNVVETANDDRVDLTDAIMTSLMFSPLLCHILGLVGAIQYNYYLVAVAAIAYGLIWSVLIITFHPGFVIYSFLLYPHVVLIQEIRAGIMTKENYPREESCCCV